LSVASAFEHSTKKQYDFLDNHIEWDKDKYQRKTERNQNIFEWEKQKYKDN
jgi:hypothetical protein